MITFSLGKESREIANSSGIEPIELDESDEEFVEDPEEGKLYDREQPESVDQPSEETVPTKEIEQGEEVTCLETEVEYQAPNVEVIETEEGDLDQAKTQHSPTIELQAEPEGVSFTGRSLYSNIILKEIS